MDELHALAHAARADSRKASREDLGAGGRGVGGSWRALWSACGRAGRTSKAALRRRGEVPRRGVW